LCPAPAVPALLCVQLLPLDELDGCLGRWDKEVTKQDQ